MFLTLLEWFLKRLIVVCCIDSVHVIGTYMRAEPGGTCSALGKDMMSELGRNLG